MDRDRRKRYLFRGSLVFEYCNPDKELLYLEKEVRPDIVVHERGSGLHNILWIETKLGSDTKVCREDREKIFYACTQLGFEIGIALLINYPSKLLTIFMVAQQRLSITYKFDMSHREAEIVFKHEQYDNMPEPRHLNILLWPQ